VCRPEVTPTVTPTRTLKIRPVFRLNTQEAEKVVSNDPPLENKQLVKEIDQKSKEVLLHSKCELEIKSISDLLESLKKGLTDTQDKTERVRLNKQLVLTIGNKIEEIVQNLINDNLSDEFIEGLWEMAAKLYTKKPGADLKRFYYYFKKHS